MTTTSSAPAPQASSGNTATRQSSNAARPADGNRGVVNLFANLLGSVSASNEAPVSSDASAEEWLGNAADAKGKGKSKDAKDTLSSDSSANPLADLIGWAGAPVAAPIAAPAAGAAVASETTDAAGELALDTGVVADTDAAALAGDNGSGVSLQGMTLLSQPTTTDANLTAQLKAGAHGAGSARPDSPTAAPTTGDSDSVSIDMAADAHGAHPASTLRANTLAASRPANWRSTTTMAPAGAAASAPASLPTSTSALQAAQVTQAAANPRGRGDTTTGGTSLRNTLAMDDRFSNAASAEAMVSTLTSGKSSSSSQSHTNTPGQGEPSFGSALTSEVNELDAPSEAFSLEEGLEPEEALDPNEFLSLGQMRHANVRVGEGTAEAIDIRLSLAGDTVNVNFVTDNAEVRAGLQQNAGASLSDLMQRSGLQLNDVSVGGQSQASAGQSQGGAPGQSGSNGPSGRGNTARASDTGTTQSAAPRAPVTRRSDGGPALDVFA